MSTEEKSDQNSGPTFNLNNNDIKESAIGTNPVVNINSSFDPQKMDSFLLKLKELQDQMAHSSNDLNPDDIAKVNDQIVVIESQIQKPEKLTPQVILDSLGKIDGILAKASFAGLVLKQLFDIAQTLVR